MSEFRRIFINKGTLFILLLLTVICAVMFVLGQRMPAASKSDTDISEYIPKYNADYTALLKAYANTPPEDYNTLISQIDEEIAYTQAKSSLIFSKNFSEASFANTCEDYKTDYPELVAQAKRGELTDNYDTLIIHGDALQALKQQLSYLVSYEGYYNEVQENVRSMNKFSVFIKDDGFSAENIKKTAADFEAIKGARGALGDDRAVTSLFSDSLCDYCILLFVVYIGVILLQERRSGLWDIVRATKCGRTSLAFTRIGILLGSSVIAVAIIFGVKFLIAWGMYDGFEYAGRLIQSVSAYKTMCRPMSIAQYMLIYFAVKTACVFLISLVLWLILSAVKNTNIALCLAGVFLAAEYGLFATISDNSSLVMFKYANVFSYIQPNCFLSKYLNLNLFSRAVGLQTVCFALLFILTVITGAGGVILQSKKYPHGSSNIIEICLDRLRKKTYRITGASSAFGKELYKTLFVQKGIVILAVLILVCIKFGDIPVKNAGNDELYSRIYYTEFAGDVTKAKIDTMNTKLDALNYRLSVAQSTLLGMTKNDEGYYSALDEVGNLQNKIDGLTYCIADAEDILKHNAKTGDNAKLMWQLAYESYLGSAGYTFHDTQALKAMLFTVLLCAGINAYERQQNMRMLFNATASGRRKLSAVKLFTIALFSLAVTLAVYMPELRAVMRGSYLGALDSFQNPVTSLKIFRKSGLRLSLGALLAVIGAKRFFVLVALGNLSALLGAFFRKVNSAQVLSTAALVLPACIAVLGVSTMYYLSALSAVSLTRLLTEGIWLFVLCLGLSLACIVGNTVVITRRYQ